ncbi:MAG: MFS transporter [Deltaproteobacteria bacterium]|nr:MFS transporter [Deltaproteobacteria bacterium]
MLGNLRQTIRNRGSARPSRRWSAAVSSLRIRNFRWLWLGNFASINGMQMQMVARGWLVYTMTDSPLALGLVSAGWGVPVLLFSLYGGVIADRVRKRNLILVTQSSVCLITLIITVLIATDLISLWHLVVSSVLSGVIISFSMPARQAFLVELVGKDDLLNAIALGSTAMNICRIASPALAGVLLKLIGIPGVYFIVVISYSLALLTLFKIPPGGVIAARPDVPVMRDLAEGFRYVFKNSTILALIVISFITVFVAMPYGMLMPVFAKSVFTAGETGLGLLMSAIGVGALGGSAIIASLGNFKRKGVLMLMAGIIFGVSLVLFGISSSFYPALFFLIFVGGGSSMFMTLINSLMMSYTERALVGRVMSIYTWTFGLMPMAMIPAGAFAEFFGAPLTVIISGSILTLFLISVTLGRPGIRRLE